MSQLSRLGGRERSGGVVAGVSLPVEQQVANVADRLVDDFAGQVDDLEVRTLVSEAYSGYSQARVTQFVPMLVDRTVRRTLRNR
jgi:hypothetical protein